MIINAVTIHTQTNLYLNSSPDIVTDISNEFTELTGFTKDDLVNKDIFEVLITQLRSPKESLEKIKNQNSIECYIFTKSLEPIEVTHIFVARAELTKYLYTCRKTKFQT